MRKIYRNEDNVNVLDVISNQIPSIEPVDVAYIRRNGSTVPTTFKSYVNILDDKFYPVKSVKSDRYQELDHKGVFNKTFNELKGLNEDVSIYSLERNGDYSEVTMGFLIDKPFKLNQVPFEFNLKNPPSYTRNYKDDGDMFYPLVSVTNSFLNCSEVSFNLYRRICANGMLMGKVMNRNISFRHFGDIINRFNDETQKFIMSIFEKRFVDNIFETYNTKNTTKAEFGKFIGDNLGKRIQKDIEEDDTFVLPKEFTAWAGLQVLTYYTSNVIKNNQRGLHALKMYNNHFNGGV